tara:strand:- start:1764 stop:2879 length:1116 start_codon:yes stop_codon:yes gene_type:complete
MQFIDLNAQQKKIRKKVDKRINDVLDHGKYIMGPEVKELEERLSSFTSTKHCITCSSGTDALLIPLLAKNIGPGDAIITTPFTYIATAEVIHILGATPVFCDIYPETFNINPEKIKDAYEEALSKGLKPKAIIPIDLFGLPARYRLINKIAEELELFIIEDAAQGFGGNIRGKRAGSFGDVAATSFFPAKPLGCYGDGGAIFTNNDELAEQMKSIRIHGSGSDKYDNIRIGINGRLDTIQAAILIEKLEIFSEELTKRNIIAEHYSANLSDKFKTPFIPKDYFSSWAQYSIIAESKTNRDIIMNHLKSKDIPSMIYYRIPLHLQKVFKYLGYQKGAFPVSEKISNSVFSLPMHPYLNIEKQNKIIDVLNEF